MIGIRSVTFFLPEVYTEAEFERIGKMILQWKRQLQMIRTFRIALCPVSDIPTLGRYRELAAVCSQVGARWFCVPIDPSHSSSAYGLFHFGEQVLTEYSQAFVHILACAKQRIDFEILKASAEFMKKTGRISSNGADNFRLGASFNVGSNGPFFPFTMSSGVFGFSIALELTQEINRLLAKEKISSPEEIRRCILDALLPQLNEISRVGKEIAAENGVAFHGIDFSLAPIMEENGSVLSILRAIGLKKFGGTGMLFATAFLTDILKFFARRYESVGFSGVMYSLLEDMELCALNNRSGIMIEDLIACSTMCGCGVDMVPVYGDVKTEDLTAIQLEVAAVSCRLKKPLGVRLLPIPTTKKDDGIQYSSFRDDSDFIANTRLVGIEDGFMQERSWKEFRFLSDIPEGKSDCSERGNAWVGR